MFKFLLPKQFFVSKKKIHKNLYENARIIYNFGRFDSGNIIINYKYENNDETAISDKNFEILYKENIGVFDYLTIINNDQFIGIKDEEMCLFSFVYSDNINSDNPSKPLNQKKIIKIISEQFFKINKFDIVSFFYDKNNNKIYLPKYKDLNDTICNYYILIFDIFKNKIALKTKLNIFYNKYIGGLKCITFKNKYLIVSKISKINSFRVFRTNNMKEIFLGINNLKLYDCGYIKKLVNLNNEFLLIITDRILIKYDFHKSEILYSCEYSSISHMIDRKEWITTKNYLFIYERESGAIIFDKKTIRPIQSKHFINIFFIDEISDENIKFTTSCYTIFCDKSQKIKIYLFSCIRVLCLFLLLFLFINEIKIILSKKYKLLIGEVFNVLYSLKDNISHIINYTKNISFSFNLVLNFLKFIIGLFINFGKLILYLFILPFIWFKFFFLSNYLIIIIIRCIFILFFISALSIHYHEYSPILSFISDYY